MINDLGIENLCNAIIVAAATDWRKAMAEGDIADARKVENFFKSSWCEMLLMERTTGEYILRKLKEEWDDSY